MWPQTFHGRWQNWLDLRQQCQHQSIAHTLSSINSWWMSTPWQPYCLDWSQQHLWPDPWQLLSQNIYCPVARALGMLYTINMLKRDDLSDSELILSQNGHNLVRVEKSKYILNWNSDTVDNVSQDLQVYKQLRLRQLPQHYC